MGNRDKYFKKLTEDKWYQILDAFRETPGKTTVVAKAVAVSPETARKAWYNGWPDRGWPPIKRVIEDDGLLARAERSKKKQAEALLEREELLAKQAKQEAEARIRARQDAVEARAQEGSMVSLSRANTIALQSAAARLNRAALREAKDLEKKLKDGTVVLSPSEQINFVGKTAYLNESLVRAAKMNIEMERQLLGMPTEVIGIAAKELTIEDAAHTVVIANRAMKRAMKKGLIDEAAYAAFRSEVVADQEPEIVQKKEHNYPELPERAVEVQSEAADDDGDADDD